MIQSYYPETGKLSRDKYPKHMQFFKAGTEHRERCMMAANRIGKCLTKNTSITTPTGEVTIESLLLNNKPFDVISWNGSKKVTAKAGTPFKKEGLHSCYRIEMSDGRFIEAADEHLILTSEGWQFVQHLHESWLYHPLSNSESSLLTHAVNGQHCKEKLPSYQSNYSGDCHLYGGQLRASLNNDLDSLPLQDDVPEPDSLLFDEDVLSYTGTSILHEALGLPSSLYGAHLASDQSCYSMEYQNAYSNALSNRKKYLALSQSLLESSLDGLALEEVLPFHSSLQPPYISPLLIDGNNIVAIYPIGRQEVFDFEVEIYHNYVAGGMVHHNTDAACYEVACHLTGQYPTWWEGKVFRTPVDVWLCGDTSTTLREILQKKMFGDIHDIGSGFIPGATITKTTNKSGVREALDTAVIKHRTNGLLDGYSNVAFKSYEGGRKTFQGSKPDIIVLDEEPPHDVYTECLYRTMTNDGIIILTFTPLMGMTELIISYLKDTGRMD